MSTGGRGGEGRGGEGGLKGFWFKRSFCSTGHMAPILGLAMLVPVFRGSEVWALNLGPLIYSLDIHYT